MLRHYYHENSYLDAFDTLIRKLLNYTNTIALVLLVLKLCGTIAIGYGVIVSIYIVPAILEFIMDAAIIKVEKIKKKKEEEEYKKRAKQYATEHCTDYRDFEDE